MSSEDILHLNLRRGLKTFVKELKMKVLCVILLVALTAVLAFPAEQQKVEIEAAPESVANFEEEESDPIEIDVAGELVRDKRQWGGGGELSFGYSKSRPIDERFFSVSN